MLRDFEYSAPSTLEKALALLEHAGATPLAGGTDLLTQVRAGTASPRRLVDLANVGLDYVRQDAGVIKIGAMTTFSALLVSDLIQRNVPALAEAVAQIGAVQCRNMATIGGNLCSAVPSADSAPPLLALDARAYIVSQGDARTVTLECFFTGPKQTVLGPGELLAEIEVPAPRPRTGTGFIKLGRRRAMTLAIVNTAASITLQADERIVEDARIALGAVAPTPIRAKEAESRLRGQPISEALIDEVASIAAGETSPISDLRASAGYRRDVSRVLVRRVLLDAWRRAIEGEADEQRATGFDSWSAQQTAGQYGEPRTNNSRLPDIEVPRAEHEIELTVNGQRRQISVKSKARLADVLRDQLNLKGTKKGCGTGECGACTVLLDGRPINACLMLAAQVHSREITTIEGLGTPEDLHPLQTEFITHGGLQCGFCGSGVLLSATALLASNPDPTEQQIRHAISGNICRCTGYAKMVESIQAAAKAMAPGESIS